MAIVNKSLNLLDEKELTEKVGKYTVLYYKSEIAKKFEFLENYNIIFSNVSTLISQNTTSEFSYLYKHSRSGEEFFSEDADPPR